MSAGGMPSDVGASEGADFKKARSSASLQG
jgi:hypothetical protein